MPNDLAAPEAAITVLEGEPMCGRYQFTTGSDDMSSAIVDMLDQRYPGEYKTGEIFPGDAAPAVISDGGRIVAVWARRH